MNTIQIPDGHVLTDLGNGSYRIDPVKKSWEPEIGDSFEIILTNGTIHNAKFGGNASYTYREYQAFHNIFPVGTGKAAARQIKCAMALARAKAIVEPEFEPDWDDQTQCKWGVFFCHYAKCFKTQCFQYIQSSTAHFSTEDKAKESIELLNQWGVKP